MINKKKKTENNTWSITNYANAKSHDKTSPTITKFPLDNLYKL
jgi:hypothetical protein